MDRVVKLSGRSIMAKSIVYFSAGVSGESRPLARSRSRSRDDRHGLCRNGRRRCNIVYEKDPAGSTSGRAGARVVAVALSAAATHPDIDIGEVRKWAGSEPRGYETFLIT